MATVSFLALPLPMPTSRLPEADRSAYHTHVVHPFDGQTSSTSPESAGRVRQSKPKKTKNRGKPERSTRTEEDPRFNTGPRSLRNIVASRGARRPARQDRVRDGRYMNDGNEDAYPDYPPPSFLEAISTPPPFSESPSNSTPTSSVPQSPVSQPIQSPGAPGEGSSSSHQSQHAPQTPSSSSIRNSDVDSDGSLEIIEVDAIQSLEDSVHRQCEPGTSHRADSPSGSRLPLRGRQKNKNRAILDSDSDENETFPSAQSNGKRRHLSLSPLRTLLPYQSLTSQGRALSAQPVQNNFPYSSRSSFPSLSSASLKVSLSTASLFRLPMSPTTPTSTRNESFTPRKFLAFKGKEKAKHESLETWEVVEHVRPHSMIAAIDGPREPATPISSSLNSCPGCGLSSDYTNNPKDARRPEQFESMEHIGTSSNNTTETLRNRVSAAIPFVNRSIRPPTIKLDRATSRAVPPGTPLAPQSSIVPTVQDNRLSPPPTQKFRKPQVVCASPLGTNRWSPEREEQASSFHVLQQAAAVPLPVSPVETETAQHGLPNLLTPTTPTTNITPAQQRHRASSSILRNDSPDTGLNTENVTNSPESPTLGTQRRFSDGNAPGLRRHYPGRPLPRPPGATRVRVDSTFASDEEFQPASSENYFREGFLIDFDDPPAVASSPSVSSTVPSDVSGYYTPPPLSAATPSTSSVEWIDSCVNPRRPSQSDTSDMRTPTAQTSNRTQFLEVTDLDVLVSRIQEEHNTGRDYEDLLALSDFIGPASPPPPAQGASDSIPKANVPLLGDVEVERRRKTRDGRIKLKLMLLETSVNKCGICLMQFKGNDVARLGSVCRHAFHDKCLGKWLACAKTCPICRMAFVV